MQKSIVSLMAGVGLALSMGVANAQDFTYSTTFTPNPVPSNTPGSFVSVTNGFNTTPVLASGGGTDIVLSNFTVTSPILAPGSAAVNQSYAVALSLTGFNGATDLGTITKTFDGSLSGSISKDAVNLNNIIGSPTQVFDFGSGNVYDVTLDAYTPPGTPNSGIQGAFGAHVTATTGIGGQGGPGSTPEPGSLAMLFGAAVPGTMLLARRRRNR